MKRRTIALISLGVYSAVLVFSSFFIGKSASSENSNSVVSSVKAEEEYYTAKELDGKLSVFKDGELLMSLDTNIDVLPSVVRSQLKKGINFKPSELPAILEAFAE